MHAAVRLLAILIAIATLGLAQVPVPITRFFVLPATNPGSTDSVFTGLEAATSFTYDFAEDIRFDRGGFVTLSQDPGNPYQWNVIDFDFSASDVGLSSTLSFARPAGPPPFGTWMSTSPFGFPDYSGITISMTGALSTTGSLGGAFPATDTLNMTGTVVPAYYHNAVQLTGTFAQTAGSVSLDMKADFYPPGVTWDLIVRSATSSAMTPAAPSMSPVQGFFTLQRDVFNPETYSIVALSMQVGSTPPVLITSAGPTAGNMAFDSATRAVSGTFNVLVDGVPATMTLDGIGESFAGSTMRPVAIVIDEAALGLLTGLHLELATTQLVPADPPINDFQNGLTTSLVMRGRPGDLYGCGASFTSLPGINTIVGDIPVNLDDLLWISIDPTNPYFTNNVGVMPPSGEVLINIWIPPMPALVGVTFFMGGGTFDPATLGVNAATNSQRCVVK